MASVNKSALPSSFILASGGACILDLMEIGSVRVYVGPTAPSASVQAYHVFAYNKGGFTYTGSENVYIMANDGATRLCVVTTIV